MKIVDYIIVGQGLAGTLLAHQLLALNQKILIVNKEHPAMASKVAAGLFNPLSMKRCIKSWNADLFLPFAIKRYKELEKELKSSFFIERDIYRLFANHENRKEWEVKFSNQEVSDYIKGFENSSKNSYLKDHFGGALVGPGGNLDVAKFLEVSKDRFLKKELLLDEKFDYLKIDLLKYTYKGYSCKKIIFCEGFQLINNPYFNYLPITPTKGEVLTIKSPSLGSIDRIISKGIWILPLKECLYLVGATFNRAELDDAVTDDGVFFLKERLNEVLDVDYEIISASAGVRPTTKDRKPLIGVHPKHNMLAIFNGLGTRGVIQAPFLTSNFGKFLTKGEKMLQNTDIQRFRC